MKERLRDMDTWLERKSQNMHLIGVPDGIEGNGQQDKTDRKKRQITYKRTTD